MSKKFDNNLLPATQNFVTLNTGQWENVVNYANSEEFSEVEENNNEQGTKPYHILKTKILSTSCTITKNFESSAAKLEPIMPQETIALPKTNIINGQKIESNYHSKKKKNKEKFNSFLQA